MAEENQQLKDQFDVKLADQFARLIREVYPSFNQQEFVKRIKKDIPSLELKERIKIFAEAMHQFLPTDYPKSVNILIQILGPEDGSKNNEFVHGFRLMPVEHFVSAYGLNHFDLSMQALYEITKRSTAEFAIRPFLIHYEKQTLKVLGQWVNDKNEHVRRLVSEGTRPRLPWAMRLPSFIANPKPTLKLLEELKDDPSEYVRRSVANHLNDITKDHPDLAVAVLKHWAKEASKERLWIIRHALRSLIKQGHKEALTVLGFKTPNVQVSNFKIQTPVVTFGKALLFSVDIQSQSDQQIVIDYVIHFVKANGTTRPKVFKLSTRTLNTGDVLHIDRKHNIQPITTRKYYAGMHRVEIQINGHVLGGGNFDLEITS